MRRFLPRASARSLGLVPLSSRAYAMSVRKIDINTKFKDVTKEVKVQENVRNLKRFKPPVDDYIVEEQRAPKPKVDPRPESLRGTLSTNLPLQQARIRLLASFGKENIAESLKVIRDFIASKASWTKTEITETNYLYIDLILRISKSDSPNKKDLVDIWRDLIANGIVPSGRIVSGLYLGLSKGSWDSAIEAIVEEVIQKRYALDLDCYATLIDGLLKRKKDEVLSMRLLESMSSRAIPFDPFIINCFLRFYGESLNLEKMEETFDLFEEVEISPNELSFGLMFRAYALSNQMETAHAFLQKMAEKHKLAPTRTTLMLAIEVYCLLGIPGMAEKTLDGMKETVAIEINDLNQIIGAYLKLGDLKAARRMHEKIFDLKLKPKVSTYNFFIDFYARNLDAENSIRIIKSMKKVGLIPDDTTYATFIIGLISNGSTVEIVNETEQKLSELEVPIPDDFYLIKMIAFVKQKKIDEALAEYSKNKELIMLLKARKDLFQSFVTALIGISKELGGRFEFIDILNDYIKAGNKPSTALLTLFESTLREQNRPDLLEAFVTLHSNKSSH